MLYKERNVLLTEEYACKAQRTELKSPQRKTMVRGVRDHVCVRAVRRRINWSLYRFDSI